MLRNWVKQKNLVKETYLSAPELLTPPGRQAKWQWSSAVSGIRTVTSAIIHYKLGLRETTYEKAGSLCIKHDTDIHLERFHCAGVERRESECKNKLWLGEFLWAQGKGPTSYSFIFASANTHITKFSWQLSGTPAGFLVGESTASAQYYRMASDWHVDHAPDAAVISSIITVKLVDLAVVEAASGPSRIEAADRTHSYARLCAPVLLTYLVILEPNGRVQIGNNPSSLLLASRVPMQCYEIPLQSFYTHGLIKV
ncbi:hypothetical protein EDB19DRAFT_2026653 [Suillus lakei]|nr:hypothetical protein EDB19DRAFT_2026653 [Suillus lakei]